jgi:hypothetical protein
LGQFVKLCDLSELWFKKGFNRGHRQSYAAFKSERRVPVRLEFACSRKLSPNRERPVKLKSKIKNKVPKAKASNG